MPGNRPALAGEDVSSSPVTRLVAAPRLSGAAAAATVQARPAQGRAGFGGRRGSNRTARGLARPNRGGA